MGIEESGGFKSQEEAQAASEFTAETRDIEGMRKAIEDGLHINN